MNAQMGVCDGVDVPGPRPSILHRERRLHLSEGRPKEYDDRITRHRLRQAFGRLIRRMGLADAARKVREFLG